MTLRTTLVLDEIGVKLKTRQADFETQHRCSVPLTETMQNRRSSNMKNYFCYFESVLLAKLACTLYIYIYILIRTLLFCIDGSKC